MIFIFIFKLLINPAKVFFPHCNRENKEERRTRKNRILIDNYWLNLIDNYWLNFYIQRTTKAVVNCFVFCLIVFLVWYLARESFPTRRTNIPSNPNRPHKTSQNRTNPHKTSLKSSAEDRKRYIVVKKGAGSKKKLFKTPRGTYVKVYNEENSSQYESEKICYQLLRNSLHVPRLVRFDDQKLEIEIEDAGGNLKEYAKNEKLFHFFSNGRGGLNWLLRLLRRPPWQKQIAQAIQDMEDQGISHGDWSGSNLLMKDGVLKVVDFEGASFPGRPRRSRKSELLALPGETLLEYLDAIQPLDTERTSRP